MAASIIGRAVVTVDITYSVNSGLTPGSSFAEILKAIEDGARQHVSKRIPEASVNVVKVGPIEMSEARSGY